METLATTLAKILNNQLVGYENVIFSLIGLHFTI